MSGSYNDDSYNTSRSPFHYRLNPIGTVVVCVCENLHLLPLVSQVLEAARLAHPYMDTYYHKRDHTLLLALHNPVGASCDSRSKLSWSTKLHSNVGFKNYLEHVVSSIGDWIQEQVNIR